MSDYSKIETRQLVVAHIDYCKAIGEEYIEIPVQWLEWFVRAMDNATRVMDGLQEIHDRMAEAANRPGEEDEHELTLYEWTKDTCGTCHYEYDEFPEECEKAKCSMHALRKSIERYRKGLRKQDQRFANVRCDNCEEIQNDECEGCQLFGKVE